MRRFDFLRILATITEMIMIWMNYWAVPPRLNMRSFITELGIAVTGLWVRWIAGAGMCFRRKKQDRKRYGNYAE